MVETTALKWFIADLLGGSTVILGIVNNLDNVKSTLLFIVGMLYLIARLYFTIVKGHQAVREKEMDLQDKAEARSKKKSA